MNDDMGKVTIDRTMLKSALKAGPDCLSAAELETLATEIAPEHFHLSQCARCQSELAMLRAYRSNVPLADEGAAVAWISSSLERRLDEIRSGRNSRIQHRSDGSKAGWLQRLLPAANLRWAMVTGAAVAIAVGSFLVLRTSKEPELRADAGSGPAIYRSVEVQVVAPVGTLTQVPRTLEWRPVAGASRYKVTVMEIDKVPFTEMTTNDFSVTTPESAVDKLKFGKPLLWQVAAVDAQGRVIASSQIERFSVRLADGS